MTDDEVKQWLSEEERAHLDSAAQEFGGHEFIASTLRTLAETRKALAGMLTHEDDVMSVQCPLCEHRQVRGSLVEPEAHEPDCIFATMPRRR